jgi:hypothetical protein
MGNVYADNPFSIGGLRWCAQPPDTGAEVDGVSKNHDRDYLPEKEPRAVGLPMQRVISQVAQSFAL